MKSTVPVKDLWIYGACKDMWRPCNAQLHSTDLWNALINKSAKVSWSKIHQILFSMSQGQLWLKKLTMKFDFKGRPCFGALDDHGDLRLSGWRLLNNRPFEVPPIYSEDPLMGKSSWSSRCRSPDKVLEWSAWGVLSRLYCLWNLRNGLLPVSDFSVWDVLSGSILS